MKHSIYDKFIFVDFCRLPKRLLVALPEHHHCILRLLTFSKAMNGWHFLGNPMHVSSRKRCEVVQKYCQAI